MIFLLLMIGTTANAQNWVNPYRNERPQPNYNQMYQPPVVREEPKPTYQNINVGNSHTHCVTTSFGNTLNTNCN